jgi:hypothetical protein
MANEVEEVALYLVRLSDFVNAFHEIGISPGHL